MSKISLSAPWTVYYRKIQALFEQDPEINILYDEDNATIRLYVDNEEKGRALDLLLPTEVVFGNITLHIAIIFANNRVESSNKSIFETIFSGNPILKYVQEVRIPCSNTMTFIVFKKEVVQFFNDDTGDIHGLESTLYENIARDIFKKTTGVYFCTDNE